MGSALELFTIYILGARFTIILPPVYSSTLAKAKL